jgi:hypothetical protein
MYDVSCDKDNPGEGGFAVYHWHPGELATLEAGWPFCGAGSKGLRLDAIDKPPGDFSQADLRANYSMYRSYSWQ